LRIVASSGILQPMGRELAMRGLLIAAALIVASSTAAQQTGVYRTYAQWAGLGASERAAYIAGAMDSIILVVTGDEDKKTSLHYSQCLFGAKLSGHQLAENVLRFAESRPALPDMVQSALLEYLASLCGAPPKQ
jgi:hypothetical protein